MSCHISDIMQRTGLTIKSQRHENVQQRAQTMIHNRSLGNKYHILLNPYNT